MYNINDGQEIIEFPVGTAENPAVSDVYMVDSKLVEAHPQGKHGTAVDFIFEYRPLTKDANGQVVFDTRHFKFGAKVQDRNFDPDGGQMMKDDKRAEDDRKRQTSRFLHILRRILPNEIIQQGLNQQFNNWDEYIAGINTLVQANKENISRVKLDVKITYNKSNIAGLPKVPQFLSSELALSEFTVNPQYDFFVKQAAAPTATGGLPGAGGPVAGGLPDMPSMPTPSIPQANLQASASKDVAPQTTQVPQQGNGYPSNWDSQQSASNEVQQSPPSAGGAFNV